jgi:hypothetical protein
MRGADFLCHALILARFVLFFVLLEIDERCNR